MSESDRQGSQVNRQQSGRTAGSRRGSIEAGSSSSSRGRPADRLARRAATNPYPVPSGASSSASPPARTSQTMSRPASESGTSSGQGSTRSTPFDQHPNRVASLRILQQPQTGLAAGYNLGILSRLPILPPPVIKLTVTEDGQETDPAQM